MQAPAFDELQLVMIGLEHMRNVIIFGVVPGLCALGVIWLLVIAGIIFGGDYWLYRGNNILLGFWGLHLLFAGLMAGVMRAASAVFGARKASMR